MNKPNKINDLIQKVVDVEKKRINSEIFQNTKMISVKGENYVSLYEIRHIIQSSQTDVTDTNVGEMEHDGCKGCKYESLEETEYPCRECKRAFRDKWKEKQIETVEGE